MSVISKGERGMGDESDIINKEEKLVKCSDCIFLDPGEFQGHICGIYGGHRNPETKRKCIDFNDGNSSCK